MLLDRPVRTSVRSEAPQCRTPLDGRADGKKSLPRRELDGSPGKLESAKTPRTECDQLIRLGCRRLGWGLAEARWAQERPGEVLQQEMAGHVRIIQPPIL